MVSPFDTAIRKQVAKATKRVLPKGKLRRSVPAGLDSLGDPTTPTVTLYDFNGVRENFSAFIMATAGIPDTDVKFLIIAGSCATDPRQDDLIAWKSTEWYKIRKLLTYDAANAAYTVQAYKVPAPT